MNHLEAEKQLNISRGTLSQVFVTLFAHPPTPEALWSILPPLTPDQPWVLGLDGKWLKRSVIVFVARNSTAGDTLWWQAVFHESAQELIPVLRALRSTLEHYQYPLPAGLVSDWKGGIVSASQFIFGLLPHQRCVPHVVRTLKLLLPASSPILATQELRSLALQLEQMQTYEDYATYQLGLGAWYSTHGSLLKVITRGVHTKRRWWYTHGDLRRAWRLMTMNNHNQFLFLEHPFLPKTNNSIEGTFSQAKSKLSLHRGWKIPQQTSFLYWYFALQRIATPADMRRLWDIWRRRLYQPRDTRNCT